MNSEQLYLLEAFENDKISLDDLDRLFEEKFNIDLYSDIDFLNGEIDKAIENKEEALLRLLINLLWIVKPEIKTVNLLNKLLLSPLHKNHQAITKQIQNLGDSSSVNYIDIVLNKGFKDFEYTFSEDSAIAKWFSWALHSIGTKEALDVLQKHSKSPNKEIAEEMLYRLSKQ